MNYHTPLSLLRDGKTTTEIAEFLGCSEAYAYNEIHREREAVVNAMQRIENRRAYAREYYHRTKGSSEPTPAKGIEWKRAYHAEYYQRVTKQKRAEASR